MGTIRAHDLDHIQMSTSSNIDSFASTNRSFNKSVQIDSPIHSPQHRDHIRLVNEKNGKCGTQCSMVIDFDCLAISREQLKICNNKLHWWPLFMSDCWFWFDELFSRNTTPSSFKRNNIENNESEMTTKSC